MRNYGRFVRRLNGRLLALALLVLALLGTAPAALAIDPIDAGRKTSLTVQYKVKGMAFTIYRVAEMKGFGEFTPSKGFDGIVSKDELNGLDSEGWSALAGTLSGYTGLNDQWHMMQRTDKDGKAHFSYLDVGLYLVMGEPYEKDGKVYMVQPTLVALPSRNANDVWMYSVTIEPKPELMDRYEEIRVRKIWSGLGGASCPKEITVQLHINGKFYASAKLNEANGWRYTWNVSRIKQPAVFTVTEYPVPSGYRHTIDYDGTYLNNCGKLGKLITIVNTKCTPTVPSKPSEKLPQTGLLWWPVPLLAGGGMALFLIGWLRRRRDEDE